MTTGSVAIPSAELAVAAVGCFVALVSVRRRKERTVGAIMSISINSEISWQQ
jgi:hypothetical protein